MKYLYPKETTQLNASGNFLPETQDEAKMVCAMIARDRELWKYQDRIDKGKKPKLSDHDSEVIEGFKRMSTKNTIEDMLDESHTFRIGSDGGESWGLFTYLGVLT